MENEMVDGITDSVDMSLIRLWEMVGAREGCPAAVHGVAKRRIRLRDWATPDSQGSGMRMWTILGVGMDIIWSITATISLSP